MLNATSYREMQVDMLEKDIDLFVALKISKKWQRQWVSVPELLRGRERQILALIGLGCDPDPGCMRISTVRHLTSLWLMHVSAEPDQPDKIIKQY